MNEPNYLDVYVRTFAEPKSTKNLKPVRLCLSIEALMAMKNHALDARCSVSELARSIVTKWLAEHPYEQK